MTQKTDKKLIKIWKEKEKDTIKGVIDYQNLSLKEKSRIFNLIMGEKHI